MTLMRVEETRWALRSNSVYQLRRNLRARYCLLETLFRSGCAMTALSYVRRAGHSHLALNRSRRYCHSLSEGHNIPEVKVARTQLNNAPSLVDCVHSAGDVDEAS